MAICPYCEKETIPEAAVHATGGDEGAVAYVCTECNKILGIAYME